MYLIICVFLLIVFLLVEQKNAESFIISIKYWTKFKIKKQNKNDE